MSREPCDLLVRAARQPSSSQEGAAGVFGSATGTAASTPPVYVKSLHAKIGELTLENDFLEVALGKAGLLSARR